MKKILLSIIVLLGLGLLVACKPDQEPVIEHKDPESIEILLDVSTVTVGKYDLSAKVLPAEATQNVSFSVIGINPGVSVDRNALFITEAAIHESTFTLVATSTYDPSIKGNKVLTISNIPVEVEKTEISTEAQLRDMKLDGHYVLTNNIELTEDWLPIGIAELELDDGTIVPGEYFNGSFDGKGFEISGINVVDGISNSGFFAQIGSLGRVENTKFSGQIAAANWSGGIAGINSGLIKNVVSNVAVTVTGASAGSIVSVNRGLIENTIGIAKVFSELNDVSLGRSAGLVVANEGTMTEVYGDKDTLESPNYAAFFATTNPRYMLSTQEMKVAENFEKFSTDVWFIADGTYPLLKHEGFVPPVIEAELTVTIKNTDLDINLENGNTLQIVTELRNALGNEELVYELVTIEGVTIDTDGLITFDLDLVNASFSVVVNVLVKDTNVKTTKTFNVVYNPVPVEDVVEISTAKQLLSLLSGQTRPEILAKDYVLLNDIDLENASWKSIGMAPDEETGFEGVPFTGKFDGKGFEIKGLNMPGAGYNKAVFGFVGETGSVVNTKFSGNIEGNAWGGALVAQNQGILSNLIVNITVYMYGGNGGALVEHNNGSISNVIVLGKAVSDEGTKNGLFVTNNGTYENVFVQQSTFGNNTLVTVGDIIDVEGTTILSDEAFLDINTYVDFDSNLWLLVDGEIPTLKVQ